MSDDVRQAARDDVNMRAFGLFGAWEKTSEAKILLSKPLFVMEAFCAGYRAALASGERGEYERGVEDDAIDAAEAYRDATEAEFDPRTLAEVLRAFRRKGMRAARLVCFGQRSVMVGMPPEWNQACSACENAILDLETKERDRG